MTWSAGQSVLWTYVSTLVLTGCRLSGRETAEYTGPRNDCARGCIDGSVCMDGRCVAEATNYKVALEVSVPRVASPTEDQPTTFKSDVIFSLEPRQFHRGSDGITLPPAVPVKAAVRVQTTLVTQAEQPIGISLSSVVPAIVRLRRKDALPGTHPGIYDLVTRTTGQPAEVLVPAGQYSVQIKPFEEDSVSAGVPSSNVQSASRLPGFQWTKPDGHEWFDIQGDGDRTLVLEPEYPVLRNLHITLTDPRGQALPDREPAHDVYVWDATGKWLASTVVSTCQNGRLTSELDLTLAPAVINHRYVLRVAPSSVACGPPPVISPTFEFDFQSLDIAGTGQIRLPIWTTELGIGAGQVVAEQTHAPLAAEIVFRRRPDANAPSPLGQAAIELRARSQRDDGTFFFVAIPGTYTADVIPDADLVPNPFADESPGAFATCIECSIPSQQPNAGANARTTLFEVATTAVVTGALNFELRRRVPLRRRIRGFDDKDKLLDTLSVFEAVPSIKPRPSALHGTPLFARMETVQLGAFADLTGQTWNLELSDQGSLSSTAGPTGLDPGVYDLFVRPPTASNYPWVVQHAVDLSTRINTDVQPVTAIPMKELVATAPVVVTGVVRDAAARPVPHALLRPRAVLTDGATVLVGETRANADGYFELLLPQEVASDQ